MKKTVLTLTLGIMLLGNILAQNGQTYSLIVANTCFVPIDNTRTDSTRDEIDSNKYNLVLTLMSNLTPNKAMYEPIILKPGEGTVFQKLLPAVYTLKISITDNGKAYNFKYYATAGTKIEINEEWCAQNIAEENNRRNQKQ